MKISFFFTQLKRSKRRALLNVLLLTAAIAFFVMSVNLYQNSIRNLETAEDAFTTIALMELYGEIDKHGNIVEPGSEEHLGKHAVAVKGYDLTDIVGAEGVVDYDLRSRYAAYIPGGPVLQDSTWPMNDAEILIFRMLGEEPMEIPIYHDSLSSSYFYEPLQTEVLYGAADIYQCDPHTYAHGIELTEAQEIHYADDIRRLNRSDVCDRIILYPGVEYLVSNHMSNYWLPQDGSHLFRNKWEDWTLHPRFDDWGAGLIELRYYKRGEYKGVFHADYNDQPFFLWRWEDVKNDPELLDYWKKAMEAVYINARTYSVMLTDDVSGVPAFHLNGAYLKEGRGITQEEYETGAKVCLVSAKQAAYLVTFKRDGIYERGRDELSWFIIQQDQAHSKQEIRYENGGFYAELNPDAYDVTYPCIMPYTEDFWETEAGMYFKQTAEISKINGNAMPVVATNDLSMYLPFYDGDVYLVSGRSFTQEDYENGNKVCIVSSDVAASNGWGIGSKISLRFFEAEYGYNIKSATVDTYYEPLVQHYDEASGQYSLEMTDGFFDEGEFEIVGLYGGKVTKSLFSKDVQYTKDEGIDRRVVIVPQASITNQLEVSLSKYNTTILLDDEQTMYFMSDMEASGLMEQKKGQYRVSFKIYDQGLGAIKQSLRQLDTISRLTLYLACAAAVVVIILLAVLTVLQNRRQIATLRSLGVRKRQIPAVVLSGVLLVCLVGAVFGGVLGHALSDRVAEYILDTAQMDLSDTSFSAMLAKEDVEEEDLYAIAIQSQPQTAIISSAMVLASFTLLCVVLILPEMKKSPMLTLGAKE